MVTTFGELFICSIKKNIYKRVNLRNSFDFVIYLFIINVKRI